MRSISMVVLLGALAAACGGEGGDHVNPAPQYGDPALDHTWTMPAQSSALSSGDLGSTPPELAAALMEGGRMPSVAHRITQHCAQGNALRGADSVVLRFSVAAGGVLGDVQPDPADAAGTCLAEGLRQELGDATAGELPAGAALLRIRLHRAG